MVTETITIATEPHTVVTEPHTIVTEIPTIAPEMLASAAFAAHRTGPVALT